ncbi:hypothetical protein [Niabella ginsengisoli]|nr:hypothetical protein [Niabella ginsengisoli]
MKEYFIIDPANKEVISYYLNDKKFSLQESKGGKLKSKILRKTISF